MIDPSTASAITRHLNEILASPGFVRSHRLGEFLRWVVERSLRGDSGAITERNIAILVYRRPQDFDSKIDGSVRAEAMRLRHKLREYYATAPAGSPRIEIPKGGYAPVFIGFAELAVAAGRPEAVSAGRRLWPAAAVAIAALLATAGGWFLFLFPHKSGHGNAPGDAPQLIAEANRLRLIGNNAPASALLDRAAALDPGDPAVHLARAAVLQSLGHDNEARTEAEQARDLTARRGLPDAAAAVRLGSINLDAFGAIPKVRAMLATQPDSMDLLQQLAALDLRLNTASSRTDALAAIMAARRLPGASQNPELDRLEAMALGLEGIASGQRAKTGAAIQVALRGEEKAAALHADFTLGRLLLLESGLRANHGDPEALAVLQRARDVCLAVGDDFCVARTYRVYGNRLVAQGRYREALPVYRQALPIIRHWQNWAEIENLLAGIDAAVAGLAPQRAETGLALFGALDKTAFGREFPVR